MAISNALEPAEEARLPAPDPERVDRLLEEVRDERPRLGRWVSP